MTTTETTHPPIVSQEEWLAKRKELLLHEKELTKHYDRIAAERRRLPMVKVEKNYIFDGPDGPQTLLELFDGQKQLIVYHFMFEPEGESGCPGCTFYVDTLGDLSLLKKRDTRFVLVSRAPLLKLEAYKVARGWNLPWYSSFGSDFNYDYHVTHDRNVAPIEYNYMPEEELIARRGSEGVAGEDHGQSVFFRIGEDVYHTYSSYARATEALSSSPCLLDITPYGRQEDFEDSPPGWPQQPTYG